MLSAMRFGLRDFDRSLASGFAVDGKLNDFPSSTIQSGKNSVIYRVSRIPRIGLTLKFRSKTPRKFYRQIYRQIHALGAIDVDRRAKVIF
jgi:hypothetical protein